MRRQNEFAVYDWAGFDVFEGRRFEDRQDAEDSLYEHCYPHVSEEDLAQYRIVEEPPFV